MAFEFIVDTILEPVISSVTSSIFGSGTDEDDKGEFGSSGWGFNLERLQKEWAPLTTIFLYRKNIVEHV